MTLSTWIRKQQPRSAFTLDVTFTAAPGITMIFGPSGSGKTTLLRCLAGLLRPEAGEIVIGARTVFRSRSASAVGDGGEAPVDVPTRHRHIGYVFQDLALFPHMTAAQNIEYGLAQLDAQSRRERTQAIAESFHIAHLLDRRPDAISGGERQRVALARSLVTNPRLLLLDEPLSALDLTTQTRIIADLRIWNATHRIPVLYVTHAHREVFALGERVIVLQQGAIVADGTPQDVLDAPELETIAQLAGFENLLDARVLERRPDIGTMHCRLEHTLTDIEVPLTNVSTNASSLADTPNVRIAIRAGDILIANEQPRGLSARNILAASIVSLRREGAMVIVIADAAGARFEVHVTPGALASLGLTEGQPIWLVIKTHSCRLVRA
jgi:molybdate transport system ATP-binding protein